MAGTYENFFLISHECLLPPKDAVTCKIIKPFNQFIPALFDMNFNRTVVQWLRPEELKAGFKHFLELCQLRGTIFCREVNQCETTHLVVLLRRLGSLKVAFTSIC